MTHCVPRSSFAPQISLLMLNQRMQTEQSLSSNIWIVFAQ